MTSQRSIDDLRDDIDVAKHRLRTLTAGLGGVFALLVLGLLMPVINDHYAWMDAHLATWVRTFAMLAGPVFVMELKRRHARALREAARAEMAFVDGEIVAEIEAMGLDRRPA